MRSDLVFQSLQTLRNRYLLCQIASKATRRFHRPATRIQETMNDVLDKISVASEREEILREPEVVAEQQRRAA